MIRKVALSVVVGILTTLVAGLVGSLLVTVDNDTVAALGAFLRKTSRGCLES